jgi:hypothetical protein
MPRREPKRVTVAETKGQAACVVASKVSLVGLLGLAALLLLLAALHGCAGLHLVDDEAGVALLAIPLEAFEVGVGKLVVGLGRDVRISSLAMGKCGWQKMKKRTFFLNCL